MNARFSLAVALALAAPVPAQDPDYSKLLTEAKVTLSEAIAKALSAAGGGVVVQAELEEDKGRLLYSVDVASGAKTVAVEIDAKVGKVLDKATEEEDHSATVNATKVTLAHALASALDLGKARAVFAGLALREGKPVVRLKLFEGGRLTTLEVDGVSGKQLPQDKPAQDKATQEKPAQDKPATPAADKERPFTQTFAAEDDKDLGPTGKNPWFVLEPGYVLELRGKDGGKDSSITITVLDETKKLGGIEARVVEEKHVIGGELEESTRDYFAISKRTNNVYYMGEDVDNYKDGKVVNHDGTWLHGKDGAHYGLFIAAVPLLGARYYQELASPVAMDRAEVLALDHVLEVPVGKFDNVLVTEESTPLEKGKEKKYYARGIGLLQDGDHKLVRYGPAKK